MDAETVNKLLEINRQFYSQFAGNFSASRASARVNLKPFEKYVRNGSRLLDVGCGNGRLAERLDQAGYALDYTGIDVTPALIAIAREMGGTLKKVRARFQVADISQLGWSAALGNERFELVAAFAVLHHIPSFERRREVLQEIHGRVEPGGWLVMSNWQFTHNERLRKKIVSWERVGLTELQVEGGDALLDWKRGGVGYRYCHLLTEVQVEQVARESGFEVAEQFYADEDLNLFSVLKRV